ncbi:MAG: acyltransferase family protein [Lentisphaeria bacterium]|nr:acyltransferase family protein [Lentisphaeria bacterium]
MTEKNKDFCRIHYIDIIKGIGIFLVVFQHTVDISNLSRWILSFHMPLFFIVSGFLFKMKLEKIFLHAKICQLLLPQILVEIINIIIAVVILILHAGNPKVLFLGVRWFMITLFLSNIMFYFIMKNVERYIHSGILLFIFSSISMIFGLCFATLSPDSSNFFSLALISVFFLFCGYKIKNYGISEWFQNRRFLSLGIGIILIGVTYFLAQKNRDVFMYSGSFGNPILFLNNALTGTFGVWCFAIFLKQNRFLEFLGNNSLIILFFHFPVMRIAGMFFSQVLRMNVTTVATQIMIFFLTITLCLILSPLINRYFPILAGKVKTLEPEIPQ